MEEFFENPMELLVQDGVLLTGAPAHYVQYINTTGTLLIVEYPNSNSSRYIEWKPNDITIDSDIQDQEWAMVNTVERRTRTLSGTSPPDSMSRSKMFRVNIKDIKSFRVSRKSRKLSFNDAHQKPVCSFILQHGTADTLLNNLRGLLRPVTTHDRNLFLLVDHPDTNMLDRSFAELNLFPEQSTDVVWGFIKSLHHRPYETTMGAFSKFAYNIVYRAPELPPSRADEVNELLQSSIEEDPTTHPHEEYEVIGQEPPLPPRPQIPRGNPLSAEQWKSLQDPEGRIQDVVCVKQIIFRGGVEPVIRKEVWKFLLGYFPWDSTREDREKIVIQKKEEYFHMKLQWRSMTDVQENNFTAYRDRKSLIEKDVSRTDRSLDFYAGDDNPNLGLLSDILMTYVMYNFDIGYVQGMSDLLSPILYLFENEVESFWCFAGFLDKVGSNFEMDQSSMREQLDQVRTLLKFVEPELASYLKIQESDNMFFCFRWLLVLFKREFSMEEISRLWEVFWTGLPCKNFQLLICVAILETEKSKFIDNQLVFHEILKHINDLSQHIELQWMLSKAEGIYHQINAASHLNDTIRVIIGLDPMGDSGNNDSTITSSIEEDSETHTSLENVVRPDSAEVAFERAIDHSYL